MQRDESRKNVYELQDKKMIEITEEIRDWARCYAVGGMYI